MSVVSSDLSGIANNSIARICPAALILFCLARELPYLSTASSGTDTIVQLQLYRSQTATKSGEDMVLNSQRIATREKLILVGLYLSKYDSLGLRKLGIESFVEAFNVFGYALGSKPASIKNYRDEFDPLFPNRRKGWHKRQIRGYCLKVCEEHKHLDLESFTGLVKSFVGYDENVWSEVEVK